MVGICSVFSKTNTILVEFSAFVIVFSYFIVAAAFVVDVVYSV